MVKVSIPWPLGSSNRGDGISAEAWVDICVLHWFSASDIRWCWCRLHVHPSSSSASSKLSPFLSCTTAGIHFGPWFYFCESMGCKSGSLFLHNCTRGGATDGKCFHPPWMSINQMGNIRIGEHILDLCTRKHVTWDHSSAFIRQIPGCVVPWRGLLHAFLREAVILYAQFVFVCELQLKCLICCGLTNHIVLT